MTSAAEPDGVAEFWRQLTADEAADFARRSRERHWRRGAVVFQEGDRSDSLIVLLSGRVKASSHTAAGTEIVLAVRGPGAVVGELSAIDGRPRSATVQALEPVTGLVLPLSELEDYLRAHGRVAYLMMRILVERLRDADRKRIEFGAYDTTGRVAARLVELAERFGRRTPEGIRIELPLSQDELAGWIGASREAVSKALAGLRAHGWVSTARMLVVVHDLEALRRRAY